MNTKKFAPLTAAALAFAVAMPVRAQCNPQWYPTAGVAGPTGYNVGALTTWDPDGAGPLAPVLVIGGSFTTAGGVSANNIATWDGSNYAPLGGGIIGEVDALAVLSDGRLVAAGLISQAGSTPVTNVAVWNGASWGPLGTGLDGQVWALAMSSTGDLYAGGVFVTAGPAPTNHVARWNGSSWVSLGSGTANGVGGIVYAITVLSNGDMVVGGTFTAAGGVINRRRVARWGNDGVWYAMGGGMDNAVLSLGTMSDGNVVAGGIFHVPRQPRRAMERHQLDQHAARAPTPSPWPSCPVRGGISSPAATSSSPEVSPRAKSPTGMALRGPRWASEWTNTSSRSPRCRTAMSSRVAASAPLMASPPPASPAGHHLRQSSSPSP